MQLKDFKIRSGVYFSPFPDNGLGSLRIHGSPRKRRDSSGDSSQRLHLPRSVSESNLTYGRGGAPRKRGIHTSRPQSNTVVIPGTCMFWLIPLQKL